MLSILFIPIVIMAQPEKGKPFIRNYSFKEYRAHPQNWAIVQDRRGVMYFGNGMGVLEYDGVNWRLIELPERERVNALTLDSSGTVFVGADQEFGYITPDASGALQYVSLARRFAEKIPPFVVVNEIFTTVEGVYFCADEFLLRWEYNNTVKLWYPKNKGSFSAFFCHDRLYIQESGSGIMQLVNDSLVSLRGAEVFSEMYISTVLPYNDDEMLIGTSGNGLFIYNFPKKSIAPFTTTADLFLAENEILYGCMLSAGRIALSMITGGIVIMDKEGKHIETINQESGLQNTICHFLYQDRQGLLWTALDYGISSIDVQSPVSYWSEPSGMQSIISSVLRHNDILYIGTDTGVYFLNNKKFQKVKGGWQQCFDLLHFGNPENPDGQLLVAGEGIYELKQGRSKLINNLDTYVLSEISQYPSKIVAGTSDGCYIFQYRNKKWTVECKIQGTDKLIRSIYNDEKGNIWLDQEYDGIRKIMLGKDGKSFKISRYDSTKGLPHTGEKVLASLHHTTLALTTSGIYAYDETADRFYPDSSFGPQYTDGSKGVFRFTKDVNDHLWIFGYDNSDKGVPVLLTLEMGVKQENGQYAFTDVMFKRLPEMLVYDFYPEEDGIVWMGTSDGLYRFDTRVKKNYDVDFNTIIRKVIVANDSVIFYGTNYSINTDEASPFQRSVSLQQPEALRAVLPYAENSISFGFAATSFEDETASRFSYYLEGYDKQWSAWSEKAEKEYTNLPEGDYTFRVKAKNVYGLEGVATSYVFSILPPWYRTYWAYALYIIVFLLLFYLGIQGFTRRLQAQNIWLEREKTQQQEFSNQLIASQENERKRIAAELHDGVNQSLVLIKNKLYMLLNPKLDKSVIEDRIRTLTEDVGQTMDEVRGVSYGLRPFQLDQLGLSKSLEAMAGDTSQATGIVFTIEIEHIDGLFPKDQEINIYRIVQECINNIIKHSGASKAVLKITRYKRTVQILISDNGEGFDVRKMNSRSKNGFGMMGIRERIRFLNGSLYIASNPGKGSTFTIILPIKNS